MMMLVSLSNNRRRRNSATSIGAAFSARFLLRLAAAFDPIDMVAARSARGMPSLLAQLVQPPVALDQFLPDVLVLAQFDQIAHRLAQALNRQGDIVLHQFGAADAQFRPGAAAFGEFRRRRSGLRPRLLDFLARRLDVFKKLVGFAPECRRPASPRCLCAAWRAGLFPCADSTAGSARNAPARSTRSGRCAATPRCSIWCASSKITKSFLNRMPPSTLLVNAAEQREEQRVIQHQHVRRKNSVPRALEKTDAVVLGEIGREAANLRRAQARVRNRPAPRLSGPARRRSPTGCRPWFPSTTRKCAAVPRPRTT